MYAQHPEPAEGSAAKSAMLPQGWQPAVPQVADTSAAVGQNTFMAQSAYEDRKTSLVVAYLLWFFLGAWGAHRFYLGRKGSAIAMLILGLTFVGLLVTGIWALVDAFLIPGIAQAKDSEIKRQTFREHGLLI